MVTTRRECGPTTAPLLGFASSSVKDSGDSAALSFVIGMAAVFGVESPSAQDKTIGAAAKSAVVAEPATGVTATVTAPVE